MKDVVFSSSSVLWAAGTGVDTELCFWKCNFPMSQSVHAYVSRRSVGWLVCLPSVAHFRATIGTLAFNGKQLGNLFGKQIGERKQMKMWDWEK